MDKEIYGYRKNLEDLVTGFKDFRKYNIDKMSKGELQIVLRNVKSSCLKIERTLQLMVDNEIAKERAELKRLENLYETEQARVKSLQDELIKKDDYINLLESESPERKKELEENKKEKKKSGRKIKWTAETLLLIAKDYYESQDTIRKVAERNGCSTATVQKAISVYKKKGA